MKITIKKTAFGGYGIGKNDDGKTIFVDNAIPGDQVKVNIYDDHKNYAFGEIEEITAASSMRIEPECPLFSICGGCSYLNMSYEDELSIKEEIIADQLIRIGKIDENRLPVIKTISSKRFNYRSHGTLKCSDARVGFFQRRSNRFIELPENSCLLLSENIQKYIRELRPDKNMKEVRVAEDARGNVFSSFNPSHNILIDEEVNDKKYGHGIWNFFQANRYLRGNMLEIASGYSELNSSSTFLDIGSGCGFFSIYLADHAEKGVGCEINKDSVKWAVKNASLNKTDNVRFVATAFENYRPGRDKIDVIVADPPRVGLHKKSRRTVNFIKPERLVYVSCNPSTFSRDAADFIKEGYILEEVTMIDMFPGTHHIELIGKFIRS